MSGHRSIEEIFAEGYKRWYQFGPIKGPQILYKRIRGQYRPIFRIKMMWQRAKRGWSEEDTWGFNSYLTKVIIGGVRQLRCDSHGHPNETTHGEWMKILTEIEDGMWASKRMNENFGKTNEQDQQEFDLAMDHLKKWWFGLWD